MMRKYIVLLSVFLFVTMCAKPEKLVPISLENANVPHQTLPLSVIPEHNCGQLSAVPYKGIIICVSPDYYKVNGIRMPLGLTEAYRVADAAHMLLPTRGMVDAIWKAADVHLTPITLPASRAMTSMRYFIKHDRLINKQLKQIVGPYKLIAGHKKDVIRISRSSSTVAIYGWHKPNGVPIQPYNDKSHYRGYRDYSHGIRLISPIGYKHGFPIRIDNLK